MTAVSKELHYTTFNTEMGWVAILASPQGLLAVTLPAESDEEARRMLGSRADGAVRSPDWFADSMERFRAYYSGREVIFPENLDLSEATPFRRAVWEKTRLIPYGETRSYSWVARQIGKPEAARAVGQALGRNPLSIIVPCQRVVASDASLCGFAGGLEIKRRLLQLESRGS